MSTSLTYRALSVSALVASFAGCSTMPAFGPDARVIERIATDGTTTLEDGIPFRVIEVSAVTLPSDIRLKGQFPVSFQGEGFRETDEIVTVGDQLEISIWEVAEDGLFATLGNRETALSVMVSNSGHITVPYAGTVSTRGLTTEQLRALLLERYQGRVVEPEITVTITDTESRSATLLGDVRNPGRVTIPPRGIRLLDLLAQSGGAAFAPWETQVSVLRGSTSGTVSLADILGNRANNIVILPNDTVNVAHAPRRFAVYGGVSRPSNIEIPFENANLAYLLAEVGGLNDRVAQARSVYVFRQNTNRNVATAYQFDFSRPDAFLLAGAFFLEPDDITYVASADAADFQRFVTILLSPLLGSVNSSNRIGN